ncbi:DUF4870 domain-containing protein [Andreprevotia chitinilytica]|uniref:DUF4870 domain-containing protein n=1 Tax=Andreprevotia chitinilytica TaxID=396808 RepID=UPI00054D7C17|nr:DUF4870 domain-containing protein [Andreprevotia chitinilytica]
MSEIQNDEPAASSNAPATASKATNDSHTFAVLLWIGTLIFGFIPPLVVFLVKKDDEFVTDQAKEALNWSITAAIGYIIGVVTAFLIIGFLVMAAVGILHLVFCILGAVNASKGIAYRLPFNIRLIK